MRIHYVGHSSFLITSQSGTTILTDPFAPAPGKIDYRPWAEPVDVVTVSHEHSDHGNVGSLAGKPVIIKGNGKFVANDIEFLGVATSHDNERGAQRGRNTVFIISVDGMRIAHFGDLGHVLTADQAAELGDVSVALIPVGGFYTIDASQAGKVVDQVAANVVIPMHYRTPKCGLPIAGVDEFLKDKHNVIRIGGPAIELWTEELPDEQRIVVLEPSG